MLADYPCRVAEVVWHVWNATKDARALISCMQPIKACKSHLVTSEASKASNGRMIASTLQRMELKIRAQSRLSGGHA